jgi:DNA-binding NarL/FixJ family response regulator
VLGNGGRRVVVLDDDEIMRKGRCGAFAEADDFELVGCGPTGRALDWPDGWTAVDVVVVEAYHRTSAFDRLVGVDVVEHLRRHDGEPPEIVVVGRDQENPYLTVRLAEAGADRLYRRSEVETISDLLEAVRHPDPGHAPDVRAACELIPGLSGPTRVNQVLRRLAQLGMSDAFTPGVAQADSGFSRRQHIKARELVHLQAKLDADARLRTGGRQQRGIVPSWREVVEFVNRARGVELRFPTS